MNLLFLPADSIFSQSFMSRVAAERSRVLGRSMEASAPSSPSHSPSHQPGPCSNTVLLLVIHAGSVLDPNSGMSAGGECMVSLFICLCLSSFFFFLSSFLVFSFLPTLQISVIKRDIYKRDLICLKNSKLLWTNLFLYILPTWNIS